MLFQVGLEDSMILFQNLIAFILSAFGLMSSIAALGVFQFIHRNDSSEVANATISALTTTVAPSTDSFSAASILPIVLITIFVSCKVSCNVDYLQTVLILFPFYSFFNRMRTTFMGHHHR